MHRRVTVLRSTVLHNHSQVFEFVLQHGQSAASHFDTACSVKGGLGRDPVAASHEKNLQQFGRLIGIDHATLQQIAP